MNTESQTPGKPSPETPLPRPVKSRFSSWLPVIVLLAVFLSGFVPMWLKSSRLGGELYHAEQELRRTQIQLTPAYAALDARRGDYETARQGAANFFSLVTGELDRGIGSALPSNARFELKPLLAGRDELITLLARSDPASAQRLANACTRVRKMFDQK
jgi:hypothetical protein